MDPTDQAWAEAVALRRRDLGRGWIDALMINNEPHPVAFTGGEAANRLAEAAANRLAEAAAARGPTALAEGRAWRRRRDGLLTVLRAEVFRDHRVGEHREAFRREASAALAETWRHRWQERGATPGWVEARWVERADALPPGDVDWLEVEDHTGAAETGVVTFYEYVVVWRERGVLTVTIRHPQGLDLDASVGGAARRLVTVDPPA